MSDPPRTRSVRAPLLWALLVSQLLAFAAFYPSLDLATNPGNRFFWFWSHSDWLVRFVSVGAVGVSLFLAGELLRALAPRVHERMAAPLALSIAGLLLASHARHPASAPGVRLVFALGSLAALSAALQVALRMRILAGHRVWRSASAGAALLLSPVIPIYWITALTYPTYPQTPEHSVADAGSVAPAAGDLPEENVYVFVFDAWPQRLTFSEGEVVESMPALRELSQQACVFHAGHSAASHTLNSMPRLVYQSRDSLALRGSEVGLWDGRFRSTAQLPSLFSVARARGFRTYLIGWYLPYQALLGGAVDFLEPIRYYDALGSAFFQRALGFYWDAWLRLREPTLEALIDENSTLRNRALATQTDRAIRYTQAILGDPRSGQFAIFHIALPHFPFIYTRDGLKPLDVRYSNHSVEAASQQLEYLDRVIGEFISTIKERDKYERSTLVLTSDHTWRRDPTLVPDEVDRWTHVPLLIRFPGQRVRVDVRAPFRATFLAELLDAVRSGRAPLEELDAYVARSGMYYPLDASDNRSWVPLQR